MERRQMAAENKENFLGLERHYTPAELAELWGFSVDYVRELFRNEDGVLVVDRPEKMHKRRYTILRIPESVARRVHARLAVKGRQPTSIAAPRPREGERRA
jgi:hypothetical protein